MLFTGFYCPSFAWSSQPSASKISLLAEANLFYQRSGTLSENIMDNPKVTLWNTVIGEGWANEPSTHVLLKIGIKNTSNTVLQKVKIETRVTEGTNLKFHKSFVNKLVQPGETQFTPVLLSNVGCRPLQIKIKSLVNNQFVRLSKTIPFRCGE